MFTAEDAIKIGKSLKELFPGLTGLSDVDATSLALQGMSEVYTDINGVIIPLQNTYMEDHYGKGVTFAENGANQYLNGFLGTPC